MITDPKVGQYIWFVIPQELSFYPVVLGGRITHTLYNSCIVKWNYPHPTFNNQQLYATKREAYFESIEILKQKVERMKSRTDEMERAVIDWTNKRTEMCKCDPCKIDELTLDAPCIVW